MLIIQIMEDHKKQKEKHENNCSDVKNARVPIRTRTLQE